MGSISLRSAVVRIRRIRGRISMYVDEFSSALECGLDRSEMKRDLLLTHSFTIILIIFLKSSAIIFTCKLLFSDRFTEKLNPEELVN